jgi:hypothetical protein
MEVLVLISVDVLRCPGQYANIGTEIDILFIFPFEDFRFMFFNSKVLLKSF